MIDFKETTLDNGLSFIHYHDTSKPLAVVNILYKVGARNENENKTGFAHLFEHLMFGGSANIEHFDTELQKAGGQNNAFTTNDYTNYYDSVPSANLETILWLESDRMRALDFSQKSLDVQKNVVIEEFRQRYLNQPFGDKWLKIRELSYKVHPYKWATIGKEISHIEDANLQDVKDFFYQYYVPNNAILCIAGSIAYEEALELAKKWFGNIPRGIEVKTDLPKEPKQTEKRKLEIEGEFPCDSIIMAFHASNIHEEKYTSAEILTDILSGSDSAPLIKQLVRDEPIFSEIYAYQTGNMDDGLFVIEGKLNPEFQLEYAEKRIWEVLDTFLKTEIETEQLTRVKNKKITVWSYGLVSLLNIAMLLCHYKNLGDTNQVNNEIEVMEKITAADVMTEAKNILRTENTNVLTYKNTK